MTIPTDYRNLSYPLSNGVSYTSAANVPAGSSSIPDYSGLSIDNNCILNYGSGNYTFNTPLINTSNNPGMFGNFNFNISNLTMPLTNFTLNIPTLFDFTKFRLLPSKNTGNISNADVKNIEWWKAQGYNEAKGKEFAKNAKRWSNYAKRNGVKGECVGYVRRAINDTFYGGAKHYPKFGKACDVGRDFLSQDSHFKKIDVSGIHLDAKDIPAGVIVIYAPGYSDSAASKRCGHGEVSDGQGHGDSDLTTRLLCNRGRRREPQEIWIPV